MQYVAADCGKEGSEGKANRFPMPFFLLVAGYSLILVIDKVLFDTHAILGHDEEEHGHGDDGNTDIEKNQHGHSHAKHTTHMADSSALRRSIAEILRGSQIAGQNPSHL